MIESNFQLTEQRIISFDYKTNKNFKFTPSVSVASISNDLNWKMLRDVKTYFTWAIALSDTKNITNLKVQN